MDNETVPSRTKRDVKRFDRWAPTYDQSVMQRLFFVPVHSKMLDLLLRELKDSPRCIIDVGCGTGRLLRAAAVRWPGAQLFGVDPAEQMVSEATRLNPNATFRVASAEALPFPDQTADLVLSSVSFHHCSDQTKGLQEIARVLRPRGCSVWPIIRSDLPDCLVERSGAVMRSEGSSGAPVWPFGDIEGCECGVFLSPWLKKDRPALHSGFETVRHALDK